MLLAQPKIPSLDEAISAMIQEESRIGLQTGAGWLPQPKSALATPSWGNTGSRGETRTCFNCGEVGHLKSACTKPLKDKNPGGRGQPGGRDRGGGGRRGGGRGGYRAHAIAGEDGDEGSVPNGGFSEEDRALLEVLQRKQRAA